MMVIRGVTKSVSREETNNWGRQVSSDTITTATSLLLAYCYYIW